MKILKSFKFAIKGIIYTLRNEKNMRIHMMVSICVFIFSLFFNLSTEKYLILFLAVALVMVTEVVNSSIESLIDVYSKNYNSTAKMAKDIAAGAVLIAAVFAMIIGIILFHDINAYIKIWEFLCFYSFSFLFLIAFAIFAYFYIFLGPTEIKNKAKKFIKNMLRVNLKK